MGVVAKNGKIVSANGKGFTFDSLIAEANAVTKANDKTLADAINTLIEGYGGAIKVATGTIRASTPGTNPIINIGMPYEKLLWHAYIDALPTDETQGNDNSTVEYLALYKWHYGGDFGGSALRYRYSTGAYTRSYNYNSTAGATPEEGKIGLNCGVGYGPYSGIWHWEAVILE